MKKTSLLLWFFALLFSSLFCYADTHFWPTGASISYGLGKPDSLQGGRIAVQWDWHRHLCFDQADFTGFWDLSAAVWHTHGDWNGDYKTVAIGAFAPVFILQTRDPLCYTLKPYLAASVGLAVLSDDHIAHRDLGSQWTFQDLLGFGAKFGEKQQYNLSYHYLHYSNAHIFPPNHGIDVKMLLTFAYAFV